MLFIRIGLAFSGVSRNFFGGAGVTPGIFSGEGVQQIQLRAEGREKRELGTLAP
jgi:hypothetical protein